MKKVLCYLKVFGKVLGAGVIGFSLVGGILVGYAMLCEMAAKKVAPLVGTNWLNIAPIFVIGGMLLIGSVAVTILWVQESGCCASKPKKKLKSKSKKGK